MFRPRFLHHLAGLSAASLQSLCKTKWLLKLWWGWCYVRSNAKTAKSLLILPHLHCCHIYFAQCWCCDTMYRGWTNSFTREYPGDEQIELDWSSMISVMEVTWWWWLWGEEVKDNRWGHEWRKEHTFIFNLYETHESVPCLASWEDTVFSWLQFLRCCNYFVHQNI